MPNMARSGKPLTKAEENKIKNVARKRKNYVEGKERKIKREGERIPRRLEHRGKINNYETVDRIAKARRSRVHQSTGTYKDGRSVKGQYFRTGLAREDILNQKERGKSIKPKASNRATKLPNTQQTHGGLRIERGPKSPRKTGVSKPVGRPSTRGNNARSERLTSDPHPPKMGRKLGEIPIKREKRSTGNYANIRNRFETASGGRNILQAEKPLITPQLEALQEETNRKNQTQATFPEPETLENSQDEDGKVRVRKTSRKIHGVKLLGLGSKAEKPLIINRRTSKNKSLVNTLTKSEVKTLKKNIRNAQSRNKIDETGMGLDVNSVLEDDGTLVARRFRRIPAKNFKRRELVLEEIHELPPIIVRKSEIKIRFPVKNPEKFSELRKKYRFKNAIVVVRNTVARFVKFTTKACGRVFGKITNILKTAGKSRGLKRSKKQEDQATGQTPRFVSK